MPWLIKASNVCIYYNSTGQPHPLFLMLYIISSYTVCYRGVIYVLGMRISYYMMKFINIWEYRGLHITPCLAENSAPSWGILLPEYIHNRLPAILVTSCSTQTSTLRVLRCGEIISWRVITVGIVRSS